MPLIIYPSLPILEKGVFAHLLSRQPLFWIKSQHSCQKRFYLRGNGWMSTEFIVYLAVTVHRCDFPRGIALEDEVAQESRLCVRYKKW